MRALQPTKPRPVHSTPPKTLGNDDKAAMQQDRKQRGQAKRRRSLAASSASSPKRPKPPKGAQAASAADRPAQEEARLHLAEVLEQLWGRAGRSNPVDATHMFLQERRSACR